jgi:antitoxin component YwqK of YwqJK toxin-antitoxin module
MLYLIVIIGVLTFNITPAHANQILNLTTHFSSAVVLRKTLNSKDLIYIGGLGYEKFISIPFTGKIIGKEEGYLEDGKWDGPYVSYYKTGQIEHKGNYKKSRKEGLWRSFRIDGNLMSEGSYKDGLHEGLWKFYHLFGTNLQTLKNFKDGKKDGAFKSFYGNGNLMQKGGYKNGKPRGLWIFYEKNGIKERNRKTY